jgi:hypothetical protein
MNHWRRDQKGSHNEPSRLVGVALSMIDWMNHTVLHNGKCRTCISDKQFLCTLMRRQMLHNGKCRTCISVKQFSCTLTNDARASAPQRRVFHKHCRTKRPFTVVTACHMLLRKSPPPGRRRAGGLMAKKRTTIYRCHCLSHAPTTLPYGMCPVTSFATTSTRLRHHLHVLFRFS